MHPSSETSTPKSWETHQLRGLFVSATRGPPPPSNYPATTKIHSHEGLSPRGHALLLSLAGTRGLLRFSHCSLRRFTRNWHIHHRPLARWPVLLAILLTPYPMSLPAFRGFRPRGAPPGGREESVILPRGFPLFQDTTVHGIYPFAPLIYGQGSQMVFQRARGVQGVFAA